jgi:hypothetical protein
MDRPAVLGQDIHRGTTRRVMVFAMVVACLLAWLAWRPRSTAFGTHNSSSYNIVVVGSCASRVMLKDTCRPVAQVKQQNMNAFALIGCCP